MKRRIAAAAEKILQQHQHFNITEKNTSATTAIRHKAAKLQEKITLQLQQNLQFLQTIIPFSSAFVTLSIKFDKLAWSSIAASSCYHEHRGEALWGGDTGMKKAALVKHTSCKRHLSHHTQHTGVLRISAEARRA